MEHKSNCYWSRSRMGHAQPLSPTSPKSHISEDFDVFTSPRFRESMLICTAQEFLDEYSDYIELTYSEAEAVQNIVYAENAEKCSTCETRKICAQSKEFELQTFIDVKTTTKWRNRKAPGADLKDISTPIKLLDLRWNNHPVTLSLIRPSFKDGTHSHRLDISELRFYNFGVTTRLAIVIASLYGHFCVGLISEGYAIHEKTIRRICSKWKAYSSPEPNDSRNYLIANDTLGKHDVTYIIDAKKRTLVEILTKPSLDIGEFPDSCFCLFSGASSLTSLPPEKKKSISYNDIHTALFETYVAYSDRASAQSLLSVPDIDGIFWDALRSIKETCQAITNHLTSPSASFASLDAYQNALWPQLQRLLLMANTSTEQGKPLFPELVQVIQAILDGTILVETDPILYRTGDPSFFTGNILNTLKSFLVFKKTVQSAVKPEYNFTTMVDRLTTFNDPATAVVSNNSNKPVCSVFETLHPEDFTQLRVPLRAPDLKCLTHLVKCGLLDTETPVLDLPCVADRIRNGSSSRCMLSHCPILDNSK